MAQPKYDVAISFLSADEPTAAALDNRLSEGLAVFFFPRKQEDTAGTNGLESMRALFLAENSRLVVVLYRDRWGQTPWTGVEEIAIRDRCLKDKFRFIFFTMLDNVSTPPAWLPHSHVVFNYADYGLEQAVGAIKARVQECGGSIHPVSVLKRAEIYQRDAQYSQEREILRSPAGSLIVNQKTSELFGAIQRLRAEITASGSVIIELESGPLRCHLANRRVSLIVELSYLYSDLYSSSFLLTVCEFDKRIEFAGEHLRYLNGPARKVHESEFLPEMNRAREYGWTSAAKSSPFLSPEDLANEVMIRFIDLVEKADRGEFQNSPQPRRMPRF